jgi:hypothetical protein
MKVPLLTFDFLIFNSLQTISYQTFLPAFQPFQIFSCIRCIANRVIQECFFAVEDAV